ncbi:MAG: hypothetical protein HOE02_00750, partial [Candidatus Marinimicrobia bacterium]|nr:hypothetical protein [Candidatus Neomarinimicrobiota bacterium]
MKKILLLLLMISMGLSASQWGKENRNKKLSLIHRFIIASFSEAETADSVRVVAYIEIPYRTIQFIKKDNTFLGSYEASLSLSEKKGGQINRKIWKENIIVDSYDQSKSYRRNIKHSIEFIVPKGEFVLKGELVDLDTRKKGIKTKKISFRDTQKTPALLPPVFMLPFPGDWGFKPDLIPTLGQRVRPVEDDIKMMISGFVNPGDYEINVTIIDREGDDTLYNKIIENNEAKYFTNYVSIPASKLTKLKYEFLVILSQNGKKDKEIGRMTLARAGISKTVTDIEFALKQMKYILN